MGKKLPSWAEYKVYKAGDSIKSAMSSTFSIRDHMPRISIAIKSAPPMGSVLPSNMKKMAMMGNSPFTQQMMKGGGMPGYDKGGPVKKDGYLTDKKGKPYARVHKGEKVVPKDEKTKKAWAKLAVIGDRTMAPVSSTGTNNSVKTTPPKVTPPKVEKTGLEYLNTKKAPLKTPGGKRLFRTGNVNDRNYQMRAREKLVADPTKVKRTMRGAGAYVGNSKADLKGSMEKAVKRGMNFRLDAAKTLPKGPIHSMMNSSLTVRNTLTPKKAKNILSTSEGLGKLNMMSNAINRGANLVEANK